MAFSPEGLVSVSVQSPSDQLLFDVNQSDKLLYQEEALKDVTGKHSLEVKGSACASVQVSGPCGSLRFKLFTYILSKTTEVILVLKVIRCQILLQFSNSVFLNIAVFLFTLFQISLHYNIPTPADVTTLGVEVKPEADCQSHQSQRLKLTPKMMSL